MNNRHTQILELLTKNKKMEVTELSEIFQVSQVTIRKDLGLLEDNGFIVREHGYATLNDSDDINNRLAYRYDIKGLVLSTFGNASFAGVYREAEVDEDSHNQEATTNP